MYDRRTATAYLDANHRSAASLLSAYRNEATPAEREMPEDHTS